MPKKEKQSRYCPACYNLAFPRPMKDTATGKDKQVYYCDQCDKLYSENQVSYADPRGWFAKKVAEAKARKK